jgi:hypothetical protein
MNKKGWCIPFKGFKRIGEFRPYISVQNRTIKMKLNVVPNKGDSTQLPIFQMGERIISITRRCHHNAHYGGCAGKGRLRGWSKAG